MIDKINVNFLILFFVLFSIYSEQCKPVEDEKYTQYEKKIRNQQSEFLDEIRNMTPVEKLISQLKQEKERYNLLNICYIYYIFTKINLAESKYLLESVETIQDDIKKEISKNFYYEIFSLARDKFNEWEKVYQEQVRLSRLLTDMK